MKLTTGQMIHQLKPGQIADCGNYMVSNDGVGIYFCDDKGNKQGHLGDNGYLVVNNWVISREWEIIPKYVSFDEAMRAFQKGKKVWVHDEDKQDWFSCVLDWENREVSPSFYEMFRCKWTIEE